MTESIPAILKKEYGCHRYHISRTQQCFAKQLESSVTTEHILNDLDNLEGKVPCKVYIGILISLFAAFGLWLMDVVSDGYLTNQYYDEIFNGFNQNQSCLEPLKNLPIVDQTFSCYVTEKDCNIFAVNQTAETHNSLSCEQKFYWTLIFVILPLIMNIQEYLTLNDNYEITNTRKRFKLSFKELKCNRCNKRTFPLLLKSCFNLLICLIVMVLWTPITALYQWVSGSKYEIARGRSKVDARKEKRRCDLTASRGELCEVNVESAFEPIVQGYIIFPYMFIMARKVAKMIQMGDGFIKFETQCFTTMEISQIFSILSSIASLAWSYSEYQSVRKNDLLFITESPFTRIFMVIYMLLQIMSRLLAFQVFAYYWQPGYLYPIICFILGHMLVSGIIHIVFSEDLLYFKKKEYGKFWHNVLMNSLANIYFHNYIRMDERPEIDTKRDAIEFQHTFSIKSEIDDEEKNNLLTQELPDLQ